MFQTTAPDGSVALSPTQPLPPLQPIIPPRLRKATGGHGGWKVDAPQSITVLRNQMEASQPGTIMDCSGLLFHFRGQQLTVHDNVTEIRGGVFVIEPQATARCAILPRDRENDLVFLDCIFILLGTATEQQEALLHGHANKGLIVLDNCIFAGQPKNVTRVIGAGPGDFSTPAGRGRCVSITSTRDVKAGGLVARGSWFLMDDERNQPTGGEGIPAISLRGTLAGNQRAWWTANKTPVGVLMPCGPVDIQGCTIQGGYYGIELSAVEGGVVSGNTLMGQMRGVSCQDSTVGTTVSHNVIADFRSSAVHTAYGSRGVVVTGNYAVSNVAEGQAALQAYCGTREIEISNNTVTIGAAGTPQAHVYVGNDAQSTEVRDNILSGPYRAAHIEVDQSWKKTPQVTPGYSARYTPDEPLGVTTDLLGTELIGNRAVGGLTVRASASTGKLTLWTDECQAAINGAAPRRIAGLTVV